MQSLLGPSSECYAFPPPPLVESALPPFLAAVIRGKRVEKQWERRAREKGGGRKADEVGEAGRGRSRGWVSVGRATGGDLAGNAKRPRFRCSEETAVPPAGRSWGFCMRSACCGAGESKVGIWERVVRLLDKTPGIATRPPRKEGSPPRSHGAPLVAHRATKGHARESPRFSQQYAYLARHLLPSTQ